MKKRNNIKLNKNKDVILGQKPMKNEDVDYTKEFEEQQFYDSLLELLLNIQEETRYYVETNALPLCENLDINMYNYIEHMVNNGFN